MRNTQTAFTLIEVLIALVILSIAMLSMVMTGSQLSFQRHHIEESSHAIWAARDVINRSIVGLVELPLAPAEHKTTSQIFSTTLTCLANREHTDDQHTDAIRVTVYNRNQQRILSLKGYMAAQR